MSVAKNTVDRAGFNQQAELPYQLRLLDFQLGMQDVYDFFHDVNTGLIDRGLERLDEFLPSATSALPGWPVFFFDPVLPAARRAGGEEQARVSKLA